MISIVSYVIATTVANMISWIADIMFSSMLQGPSRFMASAPPNCVHFLGQRTAGRGVREHWAGSEQLQAAISSFWAWPESSGLSTCQDFTSFVSVCVGSGLRVPWQSIPFKRMARNHANNSALTTLQHSCVLCSGPLSSAEHL